MVITPATAFSASSRPTSANSSPPPDTYQSSGSVGRITGREALWIGGAGAAGALAAGIGGASAAWLGPLGGIPAAIVGEGIIGAAVMYMLVRDAHDGSAVAGNTFVAGAAGALSGAVGSITSAITTAATGSPVAGIAAGAAAGALAAGGFATWLGWNN